MEASKDFEKFFGLLNSNNVRYLVVGGYAFAIHAKPRFTGDMDIFIGSEKGNAEKILKVLEQFGFGGVGITIDDLTKPDQVIQLGYPPLRIDLLTSISGVTFREAYDDKVVGKYGEQTVYFIGRKDLIKNKKATGRKRDLLDLEDLQ